MEFPAPELYPEAIFKIPLVGLCGPVAHSLSWCEVFPIEHIINPPVGHRFLYQRTCPFSSFPVVFHIHLSLSIHLIPRDTYKDLYSVCGAESLCVLAEAKDFQELVNHTCSLWSSLCKTK